MAGMKLPQIVGLGVPDEMMWMILLQAIAMLAGVGLLVFLIFRLFKK
jgi:hypothetical protein